MEGPLNSILNSKCPRCNLDNLYVDNNPYHLSHLGKMKTSCSRCNQAYEPETGFYYGAMYVSYGLGIAFMFVPAMLLYTFFDLGFGILLTIILSIYVLSFPLVFRMSRNIWLNMFVKYDRELREEIEAESQALPGHIS